MSDVAVLYGDLLDDEGFLVTLGQASTRAISVRRWIGRDVGRRILTARPTRLNGFDFGNGSTGIAPNGPADMPSGTQKAAFTLDATVTAVAVSPDGTLLAAASDDHSARVFDIVAGREVARISRPFGVTAVAFAPDGRLAVGDAGNSVQFWSPPPHAASTTPWAAPDPAKRSA